MRKLCIVVITALSLVACKKENISPVIDSSQVMPAVVYDTVAVTVDETRPGYAISPSFEGLSFEAAILTENPEYLNPDNKLFIQLVRNLGDGILRIGAGSSDKIRWSGTVRDIKTPDSTLTTSDIDRLSAFSKAIGWPVLFGLNLGSFQLATCKSEALYAYTSLGGNLYAFQFGNEPNFFASNKLRQTGYSVYDYITDWNSYYENVKAILPQAAIGGPDINLNSTWINSFTNAESDKVKMIGGHYYVTGPASNETITYQNILNGAGILTSYLQGINNVSINYNVPFRLTECNSVYGGGKQGVSDVFASALWALDFMWSVAENNGQGINFHDGQGLFYSPITMNAGAVIVHPEYYAMLAFKYGNNHGTTLPASIVSTKYNCSAHACANADGSYSITLINREEVKNLAFNIKLNQIATTIQIARLAAPSITATTAVTFAGKSVNEDGTFTLGTIEKKNVNSGNFIANIPSNSAAVITIR